MTFGQLPDTQPRLYRYSSESDSIESLCWNDENDRVWMNGWMDGWDEGRKEMSC